MYKEIFKRMLPVFIGCFLGIAILSTILYVTGWVSTSRALFIAVCVLVVYPCVQFFLVRKEVLSEMLEAHSVNTPLPIVYVDKKGRFYDEPYLDLELLDKVWGYAVDEAFVSLRDYTEGWAEKFRLEDVKLGLRKKLLADEQLAEAVRLPTSDELYLVRKAYKKVQATIMLLNFYGVDADDWKDGHYICLDDVTDYDSDEFFKKEQPEEQAFTINMAKNKNPNKMELSNSASAYVRLVAK